MNKRKNNFIKKIITITLIVTIVLTNVNFNSISYLISYNVSNVVTEVEAKENNKKTEPTVVKELDELRTANSSTYLLSDGSKRLELYSTDIRFEKNGKYIDYDPTLKELSDKQKEKLGGYKYVNTAGDSKVYFPENLDEDAGIMMQKDDYAILFRPTHNNANSVVYEEDEITNETCILSVKEDSVEGNNITYHREDGKVEYVYSSQTTGVKEDIILKEEPENDEFSFVFDTPGLELLTIEGYNDIRIIDSKTNEMVAFIAEPNIKDADGNVTYNEVYYEVEENEDGSYIVDVVVDEEYLSDAKYPVTIDPAVFWSDSKLNTVALNSFSVTRNYNIQFTDRIQLRNNCNTYGAYINTVQHCLIDTSGLTSGDTFVGNADYLDSVYIEKAYLRLVEYSSNNHITTNRSPQGQVTNTYVDEFTPGTVEVRTVNESWDPTTVTWNNQPAYSSDALAEFSCTEEHLNEHEVDIKDWVTGVVRGDISNNGLILIAKENKTGNTFYTSQMNYAEDENGNNTIPTYMKILIKYRDAGRYYGTPGVYAPSGNFCEVTSDISAQTVLGTISIGRTYNSLSTHIDSYVGSGFTINYAMKVMQNNIIATAVMPSGTYWRFEEIDEGDETIGTYISLDNTGTLVKDNNGLFKLVTLELTEYHFDANGYLDYIKDKYGNVLDITIDADGKIKGVTDVNGTNIVFTYSEDRLIKIENKSEEIVNDVEGTIPTVEYTYSDDVEQYLIKVQYPSKLETHYTYEDGKIATIIESGEDNSTATKPITITYHTSGQYEDMVNTVTDRLGIKTVYAYDFSKMSTIVNKYKTTVDDEIGDIITSFMYTYNDKLAITSVKDLTNSTTGKQVSAAEYPTAESESEYIEINPDQPLSSTDEYGNITNYEYDANENLTKIIYPDGSEEKYVYNLNTNLLESYTDRNGLVTTYLYSDNLLTSIKTDDITVVTYEYYPKDTYGIEGLVKTEKDARDNVTRYEYDTMGNIEKIIQTIDGIDYISENSYNSQGWLIKEINPEGVTTEYFYSTNGFLTAMRVTDSKGENAQTTRYSYDELGRNIQEVDAIDYKLDHPLDSQSSTDNFENQIYANTEVGFRTFYNDKGLVSMEIDKLGNITKYEYDEQGNITKEIQPNESYTVYEYDEYGRETKETFYDKEKNTTVVVSKKSYDENKNIVTTTEYPDTSYEAITVEEYDWEYNPKKIIYPSGLIEEYTYTNGLLTKMSDNVGGWTEYTYDSHGQVLTEKSAFDETGESIKKYTYDNYGNVITEKVRNNAAGQQDSYAKTEYFYDTRNNLTKTIVYKDDEILRCTQNYYSWDNKLLREYKGMTRPLTISGLDNVTTADNQEYSVIKYEYDDYGRLIKKTDALGYTIEYGYDAVGREVSQKDRNGVEHTITYDKNDNVLKKESGANTESTEDDITKTYTYDCMGNKLTEKEGNIEVEYTYDGEGNLLTEKSGGVVKRYEYNVTGDIAVQRVSVGEVEQQKVSYSYDNDGNITEVKEDGISVATYTYDKKGQLITTTNGNGTVETNTYNLAGLVTSTLNNNSDSIISHYIYTYYYDGQQKSKTDNSGKTSYIYDEAGQLIREVKEINEYTDIDNTKMENPILIDIDTLVYANITRTYEIRYFSFTPSTTDTYIISSKDSSGNTVVYLYSSDGTYIASDSYDVDDRNFKLETELTAGVEYIIGVTDSGSAGWCGFKVEQDLSDGNLSFDTAKMIEENVLENVKLTGFYDLKYYNFMPKKTGKYIIESSNNSGIPSAILYNSSETQLTSASDNGSNDNFVIEYELIAGEIYTIATRDVTGVGTYRILIIPPEYEDATVTEYTYDANGNRIKLTETEGDNITEIVYAYDANDRLKSEKIGDDVVITYEYDKNGNNISKSNGIVQIFDVLNRMTSYKDSDGTTTTYTYYPNDMRKSKKVGTTDEIIQVWIGDEITLDMQGSSIISYIHGKKLIKEGSTWYIYNAHGDVVALTDSEGTVTKNYDYNAFGVQLTEIEETDKNPYRYSGEYYDFESGYTYLRARYYDPSIGRFVNEDPALDGSNWYVYCGNNPIGMIDPSGLWSKKVHRQLTRKAYRNSTFAMEKLNKSKLVKGSVFPDKMRKKDTVNKYKKAIWHGKGNYMNAVYEAFGEAVKAWNNGNYRKASKRLGKALHVIQDSYAHSILIDGKLKKAKEVAFGDLRYGQCIIRTRENDWANIGITYLVDPDMKEYLSSDFFSQCIINGVNEKDLSWYIGKPIHKITADNVNADFENGKWVYKPNKSNRYNYSLGDSIDLLNNFELAVNGQVTLMWKIRY